MNSQRVGVIGASSMVGQYVIDRLVSSGYGVIAFSRSSANNLTREGVCWSALNSVDVERSFPSLLTWICLCPIWSIAEHFELIRRSGARRVVALSSTSRFSKMLEAGSRDANENALALRLADGERVLQEWAQQNEIEWVILRPTLIYDLIEDKNLTQIASFIKRYGFFPLLGSAQGRRQPVHVSEVADALFSAMTAPSAANSGYNISGGETMTYREMVERIFAWVGRKPRFIQVSMTGFAVAIFLVRIFPKYRHLSGSMALRMSQDLVFEHDNAKRDLSYLPGKFLAAVEVE